MSLFRLRKFPPAARSEMLIPGFVLDLLQSMGGFRLDTGSHPMMRNHSLSLSILHLLPVMLFSSQEGTEGVSGICVLILSLRGQVMIHGVAISPGGPTIIGKAGGKPVIGLPGHPASAYIILQVLGKELLTGMTGRVAMKRVFCRTSLSCPFSRDGGLYQECFGRRKYQGRFWEGPG